MHYFRKFIVEIIGVPIVLAWLFFKVPEVFDAVVPWIVLGVLWHFTWEFVLDTKLGRGAAVALGRRVNRVLIWFVVFLVGGGISLLYWAGIHKSLERLSSMAAKKSTAQTEKGNKDSSKSLNGKSAVVETQEPKPSSSNEPADRANLHVIGVKFEAPDIEKLESISNLPPEDFSLVQISIPKPTASILIRNIGKYRVSRYMIRTAIILSEPLAPGEEDRLFVHRPEW